MFSWLLGMAAFPLIPQVHKEVDEDDEGLNECTKETEKEKEERKLDHDVAQQDVIKVRKLKKERGDSDANLSCSTF